MDTVGKDIVKQMKSALGDKSLPVQRAAAAVDIFHYVSHFSELIQFSGLDCHVFTTRSCTTRWTSTQIERVIPPRSWYPGVSLNEILGFESRSRVFSWGWQRHLCRSHQVYPAFSHFFPEHANIPDLVKWFRNHLSSRRPLKLASLVFSSIWSY